MFATLRSVDLGLMIRLPVPEQRQSHGTVRQYLQAMKLNFFAHELTADENGFTYDDAETISSFVKRLSKEVLSSAAHAVTEEEFSVSLWRQESPVAFLSPKPLHLYHQLQKKGYLDRGAFELLFEAREHEYQANRRWGSPDYSALDGHETDLNPFTHPGISPPASWEYAYEVATLPLSKLARLGGLISKKVRGF